MAGPPSVSMAAGKGGWEGRDSFAGGLEFKYVADATFANQTVDRINKLRL
jgi:hypothetical protein